MPRRKKETAVHEQTEPNNQLEEPTTATAVLESPAEAVPLATPVEATPIPPATTPAGNGHNGNGSNGSNGNNGNGQRRPAASWKFPAAVGVTIEVALWPHTITLQGGETIEVYNATVTRSYRDAAGQWVKGGSYRVSELMVLRHAIEVAHAYALNAREMNCPI